MVYCSLPPPHVPLPLQRRPPFSCDLHLCPPSPVTSISIPPSPGPPPSIAAATVAGGILLSPSSQSLAFVALSATSATLGTAALLAPGLLLGAVFPESSGHGVLQETTFLRLAGSPVWICAAVEWVLQVCGQGGGGGAV